MSNEIYGGFLARLTTPAWRLGRMPAALAGERRAAGIPDDAELVGRVHLDDGLHQIGTGPVDLLLGRGRLWIASARKGMSVVAFPTSRIDSVITTYEFPTLAIFFVDLDMGTTQTVGFSATSRAARRTGLRHMEVIRERLERARSVAVRPVLACDRCGAAVPRDAQSCPYCGSPR